MPTWRALTAGLRRLLSRDAGRRDLDDELRHFLALATEEHIRRGLPPDAAARAARLDMGSLDAATTLVRQGGWEFRVESLLQDIRVGLRSLRRQSGFTLAAVASLAIGLGAGTTMFGIANAVMFRPLPYADSGRLALVWTDDARRGLHEQATAYATIADWRASTRAFASLAYFSTQRIAPMANDPSHARGRTRDALVSGNLFSVLGVAPLKGRLLSDADERDRAHVAVITYAFWQRWFRGDEHVVGRPLSIDDPSKGGIGELTVIGVLPQGFFFPDKLTEVFTPATTYWRFERERREYAPSWARRWTAIGRLGSGATVDGARDDLDRIGRRLTAVVPAVDSDFPGFAVTVRPVLDAIAGVDLRAALWLLLGAVGVVGLMVSANVASLQLARGAARQRELAVRLALGAGRGRLVQQLAIEHVLLALAGGLAGAVLAAWATPLLAHAMAAYVPRMDEIAWDWRVLVFCGVASAVSCVVFGTVPSFRMTAGAATDALRDGGRTTGAIRVRRSLDLVVLAQCGLAVLLLTGAALLVKSLARVQAVDPGFDPSNVLAVRLEFPSEPSPSAEERLQMSTRAAARARGREGSMRDLLARVQAMPSVVSAGITDDLVVAGHGDDAITIPGRSAGAIDTGELNAAMVTPSFFTTLRVPVRRGRPLTDADAQQKIAALWSPVVTDLSLEEKERRATPEPVVVNEAFVRHFFAGVDPLGQEFCIDPTNKTYWYRIVGVVGDMHRSGLERPAIPEYYGPYFPSPGGRADLVIRTWEAPESLAAAVRAVITRAMPAVTVVSASTADEQFGAFSALRRLQTTLLALMATLALILAAVGVFGLAHYGIAARTREIGVRVALGATPRDVLRLLVGAGMRVPFAGLALGLAASLGLTRLLANQLFEVAPTDPGAFVATGTLLLVVALAASYLAARRAARVSPLQAIKGD